MWWYLKWGFRVVVVALIAAFLHYTMPQRDVVAVINTYNKNTPIGSNWMFYSIEDTGTGVETSATIRDIRFIEAVFPDRSSVMVYRNEDTGWLWPPYFKWDSSTLQAEATNLTSSKDTPQWVAVTHYGWRLPIFSIFPNAVAVRPVSGPDVTLVPWVNIVLLAVLAFLLIMARMMIAQFRERMIDPAVDRVAQTLDAVDARADAARDRAGGLWSRFTGWLGTWRGKPRR
ncbi:MAG: DUF1523 family protein [Gemmobacter sp.]